MDTTNKNLGGYKGTGQTGVIDGVQYNAPTSSSPYGTATVSSPTEISTKNNVITSSGLNTGSTSPLPATKTIDNTDMSGTINSVVSGNKAIDETKAEQDKINAETDKLYKNLADLNTSEGNVNQSVDRTKENEARLLANKYTSQIEAEANNTRRIMDELKATNPEGLGAVGLASKLADIENKSLSKQADLALLQTAAVRDYGTLNSIAEQQVQNNLAQIKSKKDNLALYISKLGKDEQRKYDEIQKIVDREYEEKEDLENSIKEIKLTAIKNGAGADVVNALSNAKTFDEAIKAGGKFLGDNQIVKLENGNTIMVDGQGKQIAFLGGAKKDANANNNFAITPQIVKDTYNGDIVGAIANVINKSGAKQSQSTNDAINVIAGLQSFAKLNPDGTFPGINPVRLLPNKFKSPEALTNLSNIEAINLKVQQWASGAALTEAQTKQVEKITPQKGDTDKQVKTKVNALANYMAGQVSGQLAGQGIGFSMDGVDMFQKSPEDELVEMAKDPIKKKQIEEATKKFPNYSYSEILQIINE